LLLLHYSNTTSLLQLLGISQELSMVSPEFISVCFHVFFVIPFFVQYWSLMIQLPATSARRWQSGRAPVRACHPVAHP